MFTRFMVDLCNLHFLAAVECKAGSGALEAKIGNGTGVEFDRLLKARELLG
jgi:hypothetical protein